jgi:hypothetical protein
MIGQYAMKKDVVGESSPLDSSRLRGDGLTLPAPLETLGIGGVSAEEGSKRQFS